MAKKLLTKIVKHMTGESADVEYIQSELTEAELADGAACRVDDSADLVEDVADEVSTVQDGALMVESLFNTVRMAKASLKDEGKGLSVQTVHALNKSTESISYLLGASHSVFKLDKAEFATEQLAIDATTKIADLKMESLMEAISDVIEATAASVTDVAESVGTFMTNAAKSVEAQNAAIADLMARVNALKTAGTLNSDATSDNASLAYVAHAMHHVDAISILQTRQDVIRSIVDNVSALPEHTLEHMTGDETPNPFAYAMDKVYAPLMDGFDKVSQDTVPFVESGLDPSMWTPYMSKAFGIDGNAAMLSVSIPFMTMALGEGEQGDPEDFEGTWFMECDVTEGAATDQPMETTNKILDVVEMEQLLTNASMDVLGAGDELVEAAASMAIYMTELKNYFAGHEGLLFHDHHVQIGLGLVVDFSEYLSNVAIKALAQGVGDTDRIIEACAVSIDLAKPVAA